MHIEENIPLYFKMYQKLKHSITCGEFEKGTKIGVLKDLIKQYGVAQQTMCRALSLLEKEGLLLKKRGTGTIIPESANLEPIELGTLITRRKVFDTLANSKVLIYSGEWVEPSYRLRKLYGLERGAPDSRIYRICLRIDFYFSPGFKGLMTQHISQNLFRTLGLKEGAGPNIVLLKLAEWLESEVMTVNEITKPHLGMEENAKLLDLPDGTPIFYQEFLVRDKKGLPHFWEFISNANSHSREIRLG